MTTTNAKPRATDRVLFWESIAVMGFAAIMFGVTFTFDEVPAILAQGIQPTVFPRAILVIMCALGALQAFKATRISPSDFAELKAFKAIPLIVFLTAALLIGFAVVMPIIGTFPAIVIFLPGLALLWGERRWVLMGLSFLGFIAFAYGLFRLIMNVPLP